MNVCPLTHDITCTLHSFLTFLTTGMFCQQDHKLYLMHACYIYSSNCCVLTSCFSARTREGVQLAFEELVEKVHVHVDHNIYKHVMQRTQNSIFLILFDHELN